MKLNKIDEVWNSANRISDFNGLLSSKNFATMATWRKDFSSLLMALFEKLSPTSFPGSSQGLKKREDPVDEIE